MMLKEKFIKNGFEFIDHNKYVNIKNYSTLHDLKKMFDLDLEIDQLCDFRKRAYLKLDWYRDGKYQLSENQHYFQTAESNVVDGGKIRQFKIMNKKVLELEIVKNLIEKNLNMIAEYPLLKERKKLTIGLHFIRYIVNETHASFSSPDWLHKDDEPLVFIHLVKLSQSALGGDNLIADATKKITHVIRLENEMDTLVLNTSVYHAVTPLGSRRGMAMRDVILFTVEPECTQIISKQEKVA